MSNLKETVYVDIGLKPGVPVGTVEEYINLDEREAAKRVYQRLNRNRTHGNYLSISECVEYAQAIHAKIFSNVE